MVRIVEGRCPTMSPDPAIKLTPHVPRHMYNDKSRPLAIKAHASGRVLAPPDVDESRGTASSAQHLM